MISCKEAVGLNNKIGTCWNVAIQTNMFYGHNSEIVQKKLNENSLEQLLSPTVIENLERFLPPFLLDDNGKLLQRSLDIIKKIVINLKKRFDIKNKQKLTKMQNAEEELCERDFVYYTFELIHPGKRNKEDEDEWGGRNSDSFFLTNILDIILLNKLTHIVKYDSVYLSNGNKISLNIDKIKNILVYVYMGNTPLNITDLTEKLANHTCQFFECGGSTKYSNNSTIIEHDWRMFFKILNMLSVNDYDSQKNDTDLTKFAEYDITPNPLPKYQIWENLEIGPYIISYDSELKPDIMYRFSPFFKKEKINNHSSILAESLLTEFYFSYNIQCTPDNIKQLMGLNVDYYSSLDMMKNNTLMAQRLLDRIDANIINKDKDTLITKGIFKGNIIFVTEALKRISKTTLNIQNKRGYTAVLLALAYRNIPLIKEIMKYKPDLKFKDNQGLDANYYANYYNIDLSNLITPEFKNLKISIQNNNLRQVESLLDKLKYINESDSNGHTILMYAVSTSNNLEIVKAILKKNPELSIQNLDKKTALDIAKVSKKTDMIKLLDDYKLVSLKPRLLKPISSFNPQVKPVKPVTMEPIKEEESKEFTALKLAIYGKNLSAVESLLDKLNDINEADSKGCTPLIYSVMISDNIEILKAVLKKSPNLSIKNPGGQTALDIAKLFGEKDMIKLLESYSSKPVNVRPVKPVNANVRPVNVKPKGRNEKCDIADTLTVAKLNEVFDEIQIKKPSSGVLKAERLQILKGLLGC